jgi:signal transduction histidine kinase
MHDKRIALETHIAPDARVVRGDEDRLEQALQNLAANALRHTPEGGRLTLEAAARNGHVALTVRDTGPGIPAEHLPLIFDRFYKVDAARESTDTTGSGLGLSIVKAIVERHGGTVTAASVPGGGAVFEILLDKA